MRTKTGILKIGKRLRMTVFNVKDYGAIGDGQTDDTIAFQTVSQLANSTRGPVTIEIPKGTFMVGGQNLTGSYGAGRSWLPKPVLHIANCDQGYVEIRGDGPQDSIIKANDSLRFGCFDPINGNPIPTPSNSEKLDYNLRADPCDGLIQLTNNLAVSIRGLTLDGNKENCVIGGEWGDTGRQCAAYGIHSHNSQSLTIEDVVSENSALDGLYVVRPGTAENDKLWTNNIDRSEFRLNGRNGISFVGGNHLVIGLCNITSNGRWTHGSAPRAGLDIEPENGSICTGVLVMDTIFDDNAEAGAIADYHPDSYGLEFQTCEFFGRRNGALGGDDTPTSNYPVFVKTRDVQFGNCIFHGTVPQQYTPPKYNNNSTTFEMCLFTDEIGNNFEVAGKNDKTSFLVNAYGAIFNECEFSGHFQKLADLACSEVSQCRFTISYGDKQTGVDKTGISVCRFGKSDIRDLDFHCVNLHEQTWEFVVETVNASSNTGMNIHCNQIIEL